MRRRRWRSCEPTRRIRCARRCPELDLVLTYGGGEPVVAAYRAIRRDGLRADLQCARSAARIIRCRPIPALPADLAFLGNRLPDREARVEEFLLRPAEHASGAAVSAGRRGLARQALARRTSSEIGHVGTGTHNAFNVTPRAVLNINRASMAAYGFSPPTRLFEAAGAGACLDHRRLGRHRNVPHARHRGAWSRATARMSSTSSCGPERRAGCRDRPRRASSHPGASTPMTGAPPQLQRVF